MTVVIAITGPPGSGKSTLCRFLLHHFNSALYLSMDEYQAMTDWDPITLHRWLQQGADYNQLPMPGLVQSLKAAISSQDSISGRVDHKLVCLESHLGRATDALADLVDYVVWIDCDLDLCLARALLAMVADSVSTDQGERIGIQDVTHYLEHYIALTAPLLHLQRSRIRPSADYVYSGKEPQLLLEWIQLKLDASLKD